MLQTRRGFLSAFLVGATLAPSGLNRSVAQVMGPELDLTPGCDVNVQATIAQTEGPYFKPNSPLKRDLAPDSPRGERMTIAGLVLDRDCRPLPRTLMELWHADETGSYDNDGFKLRGHQLSDDGGRWWFTTIVPGLYPGRTRHYHVKAQRPGGRVLTTQLYFPGEIGNSKDRIFNEKLLMSVHDSADGKFGRYDFVLL
jgi:protocatechuate 3,4-dioxygenase beta subunit